MNLPYRAFISGEIMILVKRFLSIVVFCSLLLIPSFSGSVNAQGITPAQEHEFAAAKAAVEGARSVKADKYALETLQQAQDLLVTAESARPSKDGVKFTQASRLARAYAELAKTIADLRSLEDKLAATREELEKARGEVDLLKKSQ